MTVRNRRPCVSICSTQHALRVPRKRITELVAFVARSEGKAIVEVDVAVVDSRQIARLNRRYLRHAGATDVLSFDLTDPGASGLSAQIIVCGSVAVREATRRGIGSQRELLLYVLHGLLHLLGYDDRSSAARARMTARQEQLLAGFLGV